MERTIVLLALVIALVNTGEVRSQTPPANAFEIWPEFTLNYDPIRKIGLVWAIRKETSDLTPEKTIETTATFIYRVKPFVRNMLLDDDEHSNERNYMLSFAPITNSQRASARRRPRSDTRSCSTSRQDIIFRYDSSSKTECVLSFAGPKVRKISGFARD